MLDWLREYNVADVEPFIEAVDKTRKQYFNDNLDILKDAVGIPGISHTYVLNKALKKRPECELYAPGDPCKHQCENKCTKKSCKVCKEAKKECKLCGKNKGETECENAPGDLGKHQCENECTKKSCKVCKEVKKECKLCGKNKAYELLQTGMVGGPAIVFTRYHKSGKTRIRAHIYGRNGKKCRTILGYDANALYLYCSGQVMPCGKERLEQVSSPKSKRTIERLNNKVLNDSLFGFAQVDIEVPEELYDKFSEMAPLFVVGEISEVPEYMKQYQKDTGREENKNSRKLLGVMKAKKILIYTPLLKWYIEHGLKVTAYHQLLHYEAW